MAEWWRGVGLRRWSKRHGGALVVAAAVLVAAAFITLLWGGAAWLDASRLRTLTPVQQETAIDAIRGRLLQLGAGLVIAAGLVYTGLTFRLSREGHVTERYTKSIDQLGSERLDVRLGAIFALERIMIDSPRDHPTIVEVLAAFVREHAPLFAESNRLEAGPQKTLATDVQAALTVLGRRPSGRTERGRINLQATKLDDADLNGADLCGADMRRADLSAADLASADLRGANLKRANLSGAYLARANLGGADLSYANLVDAYLMDATMNVLSLTDASLDGAVMSEVERARARRIGAKLTGGQRATKLRRPDLPGADVSWHAQTGRSADASPPPRPGS